MSPVCMVRNVFSQGPNSGHTIRTALDECIARAVSETIQSRDLWKPSEYAELLHPRQ
jgi:hypothetical protein